MNRFAIIAALTLVSSAAFASNGNNVTCASDQVLGADNQCHTVYSGGTGGAGGNGGNGGAGGAGGSSTQGQAQGQGQLQGQQQGQGQVALGTGGSAHAGAAATGGAVQGSGNSQSRSGVTGSGNSSTTTSTGPQTVTGTQSAVGQGNSTDYTDNSVTTYREAAAPSIVGAANIGNDTCSDGVGGAGGTPGWTFGLGWTRTHKGCETRATDREIKDMGLPASVRCFWLSENNPEFRKALAKSSRTCFGLDHPNLVIPEGLSPAQLMQVQKLIDASKAETDAEVQAKLDRMFQRRLEK